MKKPLILFIFLALAACTSSPPPKDVAYTEHFGMTSYARRFDIRTGENYTVLRVFDPWQNSKGSSYSYVLGPGKDLIPDSLAEVPFIQTPVSRVITMSTTHVAMITELGEGSCIKGASGTPFIYSPDIRKRCDAGEISDVGYGQGLNYEKVVALEPDVVFLYGVEGTVISTAEKLKELGVQVVYCAEYLEQDPLGKAEWIRFFAPFFGREAEADVFFKRVDSSYTVLQSQSASVEIKPAVMIGLPWKDTWYVAGGQSFASRLISDAGGNYLWKDNKSGEAVPLDLESVFSKAIQADIWINPGVAQSLDELINFDERFSDLPVIRQEMVFNNNARMSSGGGNDYWESATVRPDLVLADLISVFHPNVLVDHSMVYYRKLYYENNK